MQLAAADKLVESIRNVKIAFCSTAGLPVICFYLSQAAAGYASLCSFNHHFLLILFLGPQFRHKLHLEDRQTALTWSSFIPCTPTFPLGCLETCPTPPSTPKSSVFCKKGKLLSKMIVASGKKKKGGKEWALPTTSSGDGGRTLSQDIAMPA